MNETVACDTAPSNGDSSEEKRKSRYDWEDPTVPIGNAPPMPRWPAGLFAVAWIGWLAFLVVMLLSGSAAAKGG